MLFMWVTYFCLAPCRNTSVKFIYYTTLGLMKLHKSKLLLYIFLQMPAPITNYYQFYRRYEGFVDSVVSSSNLFQSCQVWKVCNTNDSKESLQNKSLKLWTTPPLKLQKPYIIKQSIQTLASVQLTSKVWNVFLRASFNKSGLKNLLFNPRK